MCCFFVCVGVKKLDMVLIDKRLGARGLEVGCWVGSWGVRDWGAGTLMARKLVFLQNISNFGGLLAALTA